MFKPRWDVGCLGTNGANKTEMSAQRGTSLGCPSFFHEIQRLASCLALNISLFQRFWAAVQNFVGCRHVQDNKSDWLWEAVQLQGIQLCQHKLQRVVLLLFSRGSNRFLPLGRVAEHPDRRGGSCLLLWIAHRRPWRLSWPLSWILFHDHLGRV